MKKILILTSRCYQDAYANGVCAVELKKALSKRKEIDEVFLIGYTKHDGFDSFINKNDYKFTYKNNKEKDVFLSIKKIFKPFIRYDLVDKYINIASKIIEENHIDMVIAMFFPLETLIASAILKQKYPHLTTVSYQFDSATDVGVYSSRLSPLHIKAYTKCLKKLYKHTDHIIAMNSNYDDISSRYKKEIDKFIFVDSLALYNLKKHVSSNVSTIDFIYTGTLDIDNYTPKPFIEMFNLNKDKRNWRLHFFSRGNCEKYIEECVNMDNRIIQHGYVNNNELEKYFNNASFLLSTDNILKPNCVPYKILNYFSYGKPVIHFTKLNGYTVKNYINKYPLALSIDQNNIRNEKIVSFVENNIGKFVDNDFIRNTFYHDTPEYSAEILINLFN